MIRAAVVVALALAFVPSGSAVESTIYPNVGIAVVRLGMTLTEVKRTLGASPIVNQRAQLSGRRGYTEYGWDFSAVWVGFLNKKGMLRAVLIGTGLRTERTRDGVGVGTSLATLQKRYNVTCNVGSNVRDADRERRYLNPTMTVWTWCVLGPPAAPTTVFRLNCRKNVVTGALCAGYQIDQIIVRKAFST